MGRINDIILNNKTIIAYIAPGILAAYIYRNATFTGEFFFLKATLWIGLVLLGVIAYIYYVINKECELLEQRVIELKGLAQQQPRMGPTGTFQQPAPQPGMMQHPPPQQQSVFDKDWRKEDGF